MRLRQTQKPRVAILSRNYPRSGAPWLGTYVAEQVRELRRFADLRVISPVSLTPPVSELGGWVRQPDRARAWLRSLGVKSAPSWVEHPRWLPLPKRPFEATEGVLLAGVFLRALFGLWRRGWFPDLLHAHFVYPDGLAAVLAGRLLRLPVVVTAHGSDLKLLPGRGAALRKQVSWTLQKARAVICVSTELRELALAYGASAQVTRVVPNGYDPAVFQPAPRDQARAVLGLPKDERVVLYAGNLYPVKGPDVLLESYSRLNGWRSRSRLILVGDGFWRMRLEEQARQLGVAERVRFVGARSHNEMPRWLAAADVVVLPSRSEGWPTVVVEALAVGRPVVASRVGAVPEMVRNGENGFVVEPAEPESLAAALAAALEKNWDPQRIRRSAHLLTWTDVAERIASIYQEIVGK